MRARINHSKNKDKRINARITEAQFIELKKIAERKDLPVSHLIRLAVKNFLLDK